jgi:hypothetical protein
MSYDKKDNGVVMLEQTTTRDEEMLKSTPMVGKVDYSGAYEVRAYATFTTIATDTTNISPPPLPLKQSNNSIENRPSRNCASQEAGQMDHADAVVHVLAQLP